MEKIKIIISEEKQKIKFDFQNKIILNEIPKGTIDITKNGVYDVRKFETANVQTTSGTLEVNDNGNYDVEKYNFVEVNVEKGIKPTGTIEINQNGEYDVANYGSANVEVKGQPYEFDTYEEMNAFIYNDGGNSNDVMRYTGFHKGMVVPNTGKYNQIKVRFNEELTNDEVKEIIESANLEFNYSNSLMGIPFNEYIILSGKYDLTRPARISIISSVAFPNEYLIFYFTDETDLPQTVWSSIDIPDVNITNGWGSYNSSFSRLSFDSTFEGIEVGTRNSYITDLVDLVRLGEGAEGEYYYKTHEKYWTKISDVFRDLLNITENGVEDVKNFEKVNVNIPSLQGKPYELQSEDFENYLSSGKLEENDVVLNLDENKYYKVISDESGNLAYEEISGEVIEVWDGTYEESGTYSGMNATSYQSSFVVENASNVTVIDDETIRLEG